MPKLGGMKRILNNINAYALGRRFGFDPAATVKDMILQNTAENLRGLVEGFYQGRSEYIKYNGPVNWPTPQHVLTFSSASGFTNDGILNIPVADHEYNAVQLEHIKSWYRTGQQRRNFNRETELSDFLASRGILLSKRD